MKSKKKKKKGILGFVGPNLFGGGPANDNLRGLCQQLLTLLTLKSAIAFGTRSLFDVRKLISKRLNLSA